MQTSGMPSSSSEKKILRLKISIFHVFFFITGKPVGFGVRPWGVLVHIIDNCIASLSIKCVLYKM